MRKMRVGKRIYVHRVPLSTSRFCPYCCATVDTSYVTHELPLLIANRLRAIA